jgi:hypothetical protein
LYKSLSSADVPSLTWGRDFTFLLLFKLKPPR